MSAQDWIAGGHRFTAPDGHTYFFRRDGEPSRPSVVLLHGFPESWYSWRHQLRALAEAGYRAVAPDQRGYGGSDRPTEVDRYTMLHLVGDVIGLIDALGAERAVVVGHDWGAPVAWNTALLRPDRVRNDRHCEKADERGEHQAVDEDHHTGPLEVLHLRPLDLAVDLRQRFLAAHRQNRVAESNQYRDAGDAGPQRSPQPPERVV